jgi:hypothetical protein
MANVFTITISAVDRATAVAQKVNQSVAKITKPISDVKASVAAFSKETGLDQLGKGLGKVGGYASDAARKIASIAPPLAAIAGAGTVAGIAAFAHSWGRAATEIANTSNVIGISTGDLQKYRGAARLAGLSNEDMTSGLKSIGSAFEDAAAGRDTFTAGVLSSKNIGIHRLKDGSVDTVRALHDISNAASKITNAQARSKFLEIFGVGNLAPLLSKGGAAIDAYVEKYEKLNAVMSPEAIAQGQKFNESMVALDASVGKLKNSIGSSLAPALTKLADHLQPIADEYGPKIVAWIGGIDWDKTASSIGTVVDSLGGFQTIAIGLAALTFAGPLASIATLIGQAARLVTLLGTIAATTAPGGVVALGAASYIAESARQKAFDRAIPAGPNHDQYVADAVAGGIVTPDVQGPKDGGLGGRAYRWAANLFRGSAAGNQATAGIVDKFKAMGWTGAQAAGIASNLYAESKFNPNAVGDNGEAFGLGQWHKDRQEAFKKRFGIDIRKSTLDQQLQFVDYELRQGGEQKAGNALAQATNAADAGAVVSRLYERPADAYGEAQYRGDDAAKIDQAVNGKVHVQVDLHNAPPGTKATVKTKGATTASTNIGTSSLMEPAI